jgi:hypothetical protein
MVFFDTLELSSYCVSEITLQAINEGRELVGMLARWF